MYTRFIEPKDFQLFSEWASHSEYIQVKDMEDVLRNRTNCVLVTAELDESGNEKVIMFSPIFAMLRIGFNSFNPNSSREERIDAVKQQLEGFKAFANQFGIDDIFSFVMPDCKLAALCLETGQFELDKRQVIIMKDVRSKMKRPEPEIELEMEMEAACDYLEGE